MGGPDPVNASSTSFPSTMVGSSTNEINPRHGQISRNWQQLSGTPAPQSHTILRQVESLLSYMSSDDSSSQLDNGAPRLVGPLQCKSKDGVNFHEVLSMVSSVEIFLQEVRTRAMQRLHQGRACFFGTGGSGARHLKMVTIDDLKNKVMDHI